MRRSHRLDPRPQRRTDAILHLITAITRHWRTRPIRGQRHHLRQTSQLITPVAQLRSYHAVWISLNPQPILLPQGVIGVLHRQRRPTRRLSLTPRPIRQGHIPHHRRERPTIKSDVMHHNPKHIPLRPHFINLRANWDLARQIKAILRQTRQLGGHITLGQRHHRRPAAAPQPHLCRQHLLIRHTINIWKHRAQRLVPSDHIIERRIQRIDVQRPTDQQRRRHVVRRNPTLEPVQEPQPSLRKRQGHQGRPLNRNQRHTPYTTLVQPRRQLPHSGRLKHRTHDKPAIKSRVDCGDQAHRQNAVAAQVEERLINPDPLKTQNLGEDPGQNLLGRGSRGTILTSGVLRRGQRPPIKLAVHRQRHFIKHHNGRRHHITRQPLSQPRSQLSRVNRTVS
nr:hypothetical protein CPGR_04928 [Mycolicibacterium malmesburyense]